MDFDGFCSFTSLLSLYRRACSDGSWPSQIMAGSVASLAKTPSSATVNEYRPITIFGFAYRCWPSLHARHLLDWADTGAHPDIHGNRRHHQAAHLWTSIVHQIEEAYASNKPLSGLTADIEKAYNCLPRWPVFCAALYAGTPHDTLTGWAGAVASMQRHFKVRESFSNGFETSTGLAEGCALSCYGMLLLDHLLHMWLHAQCPEVRCLSYVDNWDLLTWDPEWACRQLDLVVHVASTVEMRATCSGSANPSTNPSNTMELTPARRPHKAWAAFERMTVQYDLPMGTLETACSPLFQATVRRALTFTLKGEGLRRSWGQNESRAETRSWRAALVCCLE